MRSAILATFAFALAAPALAAPDLFAEAASRQPGTAYTPNGEGDPGAIICRTPQPLPDGASGPKVCMHNSVWAQLTLTGKDLAADGKTVIARPMVDDPQGLGEPEAVTCRKPQEIPTGWHLKDFGPEVCLSNQTWARLKAEHKELAADGHSVINIDLVSQPFPGRMTGVGTSATTSLNANIIHH